VRLNKMKPNDTITPTSSSRGATPQPCASRQSPSKISQIRNSNINIASVLDLDKDCEISPVLTNGVDRTRHSIQKVTNWQTMATDQPTCKSDVMDNSHLGLGSGLSKGRSTSFEALKGAVNELYSLDDFNKETLDSGFFSDVFKVVHKTTGKLMVLKMNKERSNRSKFLKEIFLLNTLKHPNILRLEAGCVHAGQLHALTEYISGGNLEQLIKDKSKDLPWATRIDLSVQIAKGLMYLNSQGYFHRDLTSKNILIKSEEVAARRGYNFRNERGKKLVAVIGDFGLATRIPKKNSRRLPQVGSPYWMSPECLRGERYDQSADIFSFGIISCEIIARCDADPDIGIPRTPNFGVDYRAFSQMCPNCPPEYLKIAFTCLSIEPSTRPRSNELVSQLKTLAEEFKSVSSLQNNQSQFSRRILHSQFEAELNHRKSPSEKARIHKTVQSVGEEMCLKDPHYTPRNSLTVNPFALLPRLREGKKLVGSSVDLFSSCFEMPSPRVASPTNTTSTSRSLPSSPTCPHNETPGFGENKSVTRNTTISSTISSLNKLYSARGYLSQDDSALGLSSTPLQISGTGNLKRWGSVESGVYSVTDDWFSEEPISSTRSICSSLLTVSDLEEDLRMASQFLAKKRSSSVFTDSLEDLSTRLDDLSNTGTGKEDIKALERGYEKDIRDIVEYFERNCRTDKKKNIEVGGGLSDVRSSPEIARSQKIESLIMAVAKNKNKAEARLRRGASPHSPSHLQVCHGIVQSKLQIFDHTKRRQPRPRYEQNGFVKARRAIFDVPPTSSKSAIRKHLTAGTSFGRFTLNTGTGPCKNTGAIPKRNSEVTRNNSLKNTEVTRNTSIRNTEVTRNKSIRNTEVTRNTETPRNTGPHVFKNKISPSSVKKVVSSHEESQPSKLDKCKESEAKVEK